jgi:GNAT superfamily N-acetyltransferase
MEVPPAVRALALHPFRELPLPPAFERIERDGVQLVFSPYPNAQIVDPLDLTVAGVPAAVETSRTAARERGKRLLAWWIAPGHDELVPALEREGLVNADTPGYEAVENAMALVSEPRHGRVDPGVEVSEVETYEDYVAAMLVLMDAFEIPDAMRDEAVRELPRRWEEYRQPGNPSSQYLATIGGEVVGTAGAGLGDAGVNLFGGAVLPPARGRGVYRALTLARWEAAVRRGSPALTVQAGRMSRPVLAKLGFALVGQVHLYVDEVD